MSVADESDIESETGSLADFIANDDAEATTVNLFDLADPVGAAGPVGPKPKPAVAAPPSPSADRFTIKFLNPHNFQNFIHVASANVERLSFQIKKKSTGFTGLQIVCRNNGFSVLAQGRYQCMIDGAGVDGITLRVRAKSFALVLAELCKNMGTSSNGCPVVIISQPLDCPDIIRFTTSSLERQTSSSYELPLITDEDIDGDMFQMFKIEDPFTASIELSVMRDFVNSAIRAETEDLGLELAEAPCVTDDSIVHYRLRMQYRSDLISDAKKDLYINVKPSDEDDESAEIVIHGGYATAHFVTGYYHEFPAKHLAAFLKNMHSATVQVSLKKDSPLVLVSNYTENTYWRIYLAPNSVSKAGPSVASTDDDEASA